MEKVLCKNCNFTLGTAGFIGRDTIGRFIKCAECGDEMKKQAWVLHVSETMVSMICPKCFKKAVKKGIKCPKCFQVHSK
jgi:hypothetical protein